ncbi:MAG: deoxyribose-phosphate aldolase [Lachnospiraceae bacterium]|nr:deoxyribose-phosphate aldolase [Lachnospiraceae bacterium]
MINLNEWPVEKFAKVFDMAVLAPDTQEAAIREACRQAKAYNIAAMYTTPCWTKVVAEELAGSDVHVGVGIGFPYGTPTTAIKMAEVDDAIANGGTALDMVINIGALKDGDLDLTRAEIQGFAEKTKAAGCLSKVIIEVGFLTDEEIATVTKMICECGIDYVKTATGSQALPDVHHLEVIKANLSGKTKLKLSGVPRQFVLSACLRMLEIGVELIGTRSAIKIIDEYKAYRKENGLTE